MGASAIEQIYMPNCLCARGIKPTKSQKSEENWVFKLARSTYAQADKISPRTTTSRHRRTALVPSAGPEHHRERRRAPPRADTSERPRASSRTPPRTTTSRHLRTAPVLSASLDASHREQRRFFPRAPVPASFY